MALRIDVGELADWVDEAGERGFTLRCDVSPDLLKFFDQ